MQTTTAAHEKRAGSSVGYLLRQWRAERGMSQLDLAMHAGLSARHVSFIETGRSQPSRQALLVLAETLEVPLRERNRLLEAGGYAHTYRQTPLGARRWVVNWNEVARTMLGRAERELGQSTDAEAAALLSELHAYAEASLRQRPSAAVGPADLLLPIHIRKDDLELRLFSTIMTLGTPQDVTLQELRIETFFPADAASERSSRKMTADQ